MIGEAGGAAIAMALDAGVEADVEAMVSRSISEFGGIDVFFANAATWLGNISISTKPSSSGTK